MESLTLFVIKSGNGEFFDREAAIKSFGSLPEKIIDIEKQSDINGTEISSKWFGVIFDDELLEESLLEALPIFFNAEYEYLVVYKVDEKLDKAWSSPRFFRSGVKLQYESLLPCECDSMASEIILNGVIKRNVGGKSII